MKRLILQLCLIVGFTTQGFCNDFVQIMLDGKDAIDKCLQNSKMEYSECYLMVYDIKKDFKKVMLDGQEKVNNCLRSASLGQDQATECYLALNNSCYKKYSCSDCMAGMILFFNVAANKNSTYDEKKFALTRTAEFYKFMTDKCPALELMFVMSVNYLRDTIEKVFND